MNYPQFAYSSIATATTTLVSTGTGILHTITITGGTAGTIVVYDNTAASGTVLANMASTNTPITLTLDVTFSKGLTVVTGGNTNLLISYLK